jgi:hypothetical protein
MPKRTSREEFDDRLNIVARDTFLLDIQTSGGDIGRASLAVARWRAAEIAKQAPTRKSGIVRFFESTLIGKPVAVLAENIEASIAEHGPILGTVRGLLIGIMVAAALIAATEGVGFVFDLGRYWINMKYGESQKAEMRRKLLKEGSEGVPLHTLDEPYGGPGSPAVSSAKTGPGPILPAWKTLSNRAAFVSITEDQFINAAKVETEPFFLSKMYERGDELSRSQYFLKEGTRYEVSPLPISGTVKFPNGITALIIKIEDGRFGLIPVEAAQPTPPK